MKILYVIENNNFGGGEQAFLQLAKGLNRREFEPIFACSGNEPLVSNLKKENIKIYPIGMHKQISLNLLSQLINIIKTEKPDIIHSQSGRANFYSRIAKNYSDITIKSVSTIAVPVELFDNINYFKKTFYILADKLTEKYTNKFIAVSESLKKWLINNHNITANNILTIYNGIELERFNPKVYDPEKIRKELNLDNNLILIGTIGRLTYEKAQRFFIQAAENILKLHSNIKFLIIGDGDLRKTLEKMAKDLNIYQYFLFTGFREDIPELLSALDIYVLPSIHEGQPVSLLEAMCMGKPCVVTNIEGINEVVKDNENALVSQSANPGSIAEKILFLLKDKIKARELGKNARETVRNKFSVKNTISAHEKLYHELKNE
ncbi:MAG: glycosyltransferase [Endomicrobiales bacterium]|nr:glycosyltransferase [Endomicrobiales bacterium]